MLYLPFRTIISDFQSVLRLRNRSGLQRWKVVLVQKTITHNDKSIRKHFKLRIRCWRLLVICIK